MCCGAEGPTDWIGRKNVIIGVSSEPQVYDIPESCCRKGIEVDTCRAATRAQFGAQIDTKLIYDEGCVTKVAKCIRKNLSIFIGIGLSIITIEVIGLIFSLILTFAVNNNKRYKA